MLLLSDAGAMQVQFNVEMIPVTDIDAPRGGSILKMPQIEIAKTGPDSTSVAFMELSRQSKFERPYFAPRVPFCTWRLRLL